MATAVKVSKTRGHQVYRLADGTTVKGATTILNTLSKPVLTKWANNLGLQGTDSEKYTTDMAERGTLLHAMVQARWEGVELDRSEFSEAQIRSADIAYGKFLEWRSEHEVEVIATELQLVSERYRYGGTIDLVCKLDGYPMLVDYKTSKAIYDDQALQLAAYRVLLHENGYEIGLPGVGQAILRLGRTEAEGPFEFRTMPLIPDHWRLFLAAKEVYELRGKLFGRGS